MTPKHHITITSSILAVIAVFGLSVSVLVSPASSEAQNIESRFSSKTDSLCAGQAWPNYSQGCLAWINGKDARIAERNISFEIRDEKRGVSTLIKAKAPSNEFAMSTASQ
jgi:hypothetical protein